MGTLTGSLPELADHCPHKLPSSCRLTSTPLCCACYDRRPHTTTYRKYIDGVGFVQRGTRWQDYCWFCYEFWNNRVKAAGLDPKDTRIPEHPDQTEFAKRWFEFKRGYLLETDEDGEEVRVEVQMGEPWREVDPGVLPRTPEEIENPEVARRRQQAEAAEARRIQAAQATPAAQVQSIESALDELLEEVEESIETMEAIEDNLDARTSDLRALAAQASTNLPEAAAPNANMETRQQRQQRRERRIENFTRVFGTREDLQDENYQSPIGGMFQRAWGRYQVAEEVRRAAPPEMQPSAAEQHVYYYMNDGTAVPVSDREPQLSGVLDALRTAYGRTQRLQRPQRPRSPERGLDIDDGRPPPMAREDMVKNMECQVCYQQLATEALLPCGHLAMCRWCADQVVPFRHSAEDGRLRGNAHCPCCRRGARRRVKIYVG